METPPGFSSSFVHIRKFSIDMASEPMRVAVVGLGEHGKNHARQYLQIPGVQLVGVFDMEQERSRQAAEELSVPSFASYQETLAQVDAVSVVVPTRDHASVALEALRAGKDVLVEKPISRTLAEADEMIEVAAQGNCILQVGHLERFNPAVLAAEKVVRDPKFFEIHRLGVFAPRSLDVDVVFDLMIHDLEILLSLVAAPVAEIRAVGLPILSDRVDIANVRLEFEGGVVANLTASRVSTEKIRKFRFFQASGYVSIDFTRQDVILLGIERGGLRPEIGLKKVETERADPLRGQLEDFTQCVRTRRPPKVGGGEGRAALDLAQRVMKEIEKHALAAGVRIRP